MEADVIMSQQELHRVPVITAVLAKQLCQAEAAQMLGLSTRQVRRLSRWLQQEGPAGLAHRARGRPSNARLAPRVRERALTLIRQHYPDFGPTLASEMLAARHQIRLSEETLRGWMRQAGLWAGRRRPRPHRAWRERAACLGQLVQLDGSHHAWLEARGPRLVLMGYVDDATGRVWARFYPSEDLPAAFDSFGRYARRYGLPQAVYLDKHTIYRSPKTPTLEEQLAGQWPQSQFERALAELGVRMIHAHSPQAKGRVERLFGTLQDRLVKSLRLAGAQTLPEANRHLQGFLSAYNARFRRAARELADLHRPVPPTLQLDQILCVQEARIVANDDTIRVQGQHLQLRAPNGQSLAQRRVTVLLRADGRRRVLDGQAALAATPLPPPRPRQTGLPRRRGRVQPPPLSHPWRRYPRPNVEVARA
jgi:transposase